MRLTSFTKQDHIDLVNAIRKEIFYNRNYPPIPFQEFLKPEITTPIEDYALASLGIAY